MSSPAPLARIKGAVEGAKPSPFCILDEVDAALDERNIGRFVLILQEFLQQC